MDMLKTIINEDGLPVLIKEREIELNQKLEKYDNAKVVVDVLKEGLNHHLETEEVAYLVCLNPRMKIIGVFLLSVGSQTRVLTNPEIVYKKALLCGAYGIVIAHNHPSNDYSPSQEDDYCFSILVRSGMLLNISLFDYLIITRNGYLSYAESGFYESIIKKTEEDSTFSD